MPTHTPAVPRGARRYEPDRYVIRVGSDWSPVRAATIWPIADVLDARGCVEPPAAAVDVDGVQTLDLLDTGMMIASPVVRRRRERRVSSRAVFYQAAVD